MAGPLKVANIHFDIVGQNRIELQPGSNTVNVVANAIQIPIGTSSGRPGGSRPGLIRYNTDLGAFEFYFIGGWDTVVGSNAIGSQASVPPFAQANLAYSTANSAFIAANAAPGIANSYANLVGQSANSWANTVGTAGNNYTNTVTASDRAYTNTTTTAANNWANNVGVAANSYAAVAFNKANTAMQNNVTTQITVGYTYQVFNAGANIAAYGTWTPNAANNNYQYGTSNGAVTIAAPPADSAIDFLWTNGINAQAITFSGYTVQSGGTGDAYVTTNAFQFLFSIRRINGVSTYTIKALQ